MGRTENAWSLWMTQGHPFRLGCRTAALEAIIERRFRLLAERGGKMSRLNDWVVALLRLQEFAKRKFYKWE